MIITKQVCKFRADLVRWANGRQTDLLSREVSPQDKLNLGYSARPLPYPSMHVGVLHFAGLHPAGGAAVATSRFSDGICALERARPPSAWREWDGRRRSTARRFTDGRLSRPILPGPDLESVA